MLNTLLENELNEMNEIMEEQITRFKVDSIESANWCFRKIRALNEKIAETNKLAEAEIDRINAWRKQENERAERAINYFEGLLTEYYIQLKAQDPKAKLSTPYGKITSRKSKKWLYKNEDETKKWLKDNGYIELIRVKEELDKANLKKIFKDGIDSSTGEVVPGIAITEEENILIKVE